MDLKEIFWIIEEYRREALVPSAARLDLSKEKIKNLSLEEAAEEIQPLIDEALEILAAIANLENLEDSDVELRELAYFYLVHDFNEMLPLNYPYIMALMKIKDGDFAPGINVVCRDDVPGIRELLSKNTVPIFYKSKYKAPVEFEMWQEGDLLKELEERGLDIKNPE